MVGRGRVLRRGRRGRPRLLVRVTLMILVGTQAKSLCATDGSHGSRVRKGVRMWLCCSRGTLENSSAILGYDLDCSLFSPSAADVALGSCNIPRDVDLARFGYAYGGLRDRKLQCIV